MSAGIRSAVLGALAVVTAAGVWLTGGQEQELGNLWALAVPLVPFVFATETIASVRPEWFRRGRLVEVAALGAFVAVFCFLVPKIFAAAMDGDLDRHYAWMRVLVPTLILCLVFALRLGGGGAATVRRVGYAGILIMLSGIEDLTFQLLRGNGVAEQWDWADHMTVVLGHVASRTEAYAFIAVHLIIAVVVVCLPDRLWHRAGGEVQRRVRARTR
ncbi:hypothetical protein Ntsu_59550 [Nocardia sp. IFM 10818]